MSTRNDIHGGPRVPDAIQTYLLKKGGKNPFGEPNFRLVWSPSRLHWKGGKFNDWDDNIAAHERGGILRLKSGLLVPNGHTPIRSVVEVRQVPKYAFDAGWVLERWVPAAYYGGRDAWNARHVPGFPQVPFGGPYPHEGDFEMCHNSASIELPSISQLQNAIDRCEHARSTHKGSVAGMVQDRINRMVEEYETARAKEKQETEARIRDFMNTLYSDSLNAGAMRTQMARTAGITEHVGN